MMVVPSYSIIMPVFNSRDFLRESIDSVCNQTEKNWELICIDDGSTDGSSLILDEYASLDSRIRVFHKGNEGVGVARNFGLDRARGEWICWLDSDDILNSATLSQFRALSMEEQQCQLLMMGRVDFCIDSHPNFKDGSFESGSVDVSKRLTFRECVPNMWQFAFNRKAFRDVRFRRFRYGEDRIYLAECMLKVDAYAYSNRGCYGYRNNPKSLSHRLLSNKEFESFVDHNVFLCSIYCASSKTLSEDARRYLILFWTEFTVAMIDLIGGWKEKGRAWKYWSKRLKVFSQIDGLSIWWRLVIYICANVPCRVCGFIMCYIPHWLKLKGFHR